MSGVQFPQSTMDDVVFVDCKLNDANFRMIRADRIRFDDVNLRDAEFSTGQLASACFLDSDLRGTEFSQTVMPGARLHGSDVTDLRGAEYLRDIVIDTTQVLPLARGVFAALHISIDDDPDPASGKEPA